jgi:hypothetical protein
MVTDKLTVSQLVKKFGVFFFFFGNLKVLYVFARVLVPNLSRFSPLHFFEPCFFNISW